MAKTKNSLSEIHWLTCMLEHGCVSASLAALWKSPSLPHNTYITVRYSITWQTPREAQDIYTSVICSCTWSHLEWPPALWHFPDLRRVEERLGEICFVLWDTQSLPVSSFFFQIEQAPTLVTAGMSPDPWRTAIPELWLLCLVSVQRYKHETQVLDHAERKCRSVTHHGHKTLWHCGSCTWPPAPQSSTKWWWKEAKVQSVLLTCTGHDTCMVQEVTPAVLKNPSTFTPGNGHEEGCIWLSLQDSPSHFCTSSGASCCGWMPIFGWVHVFSEHSFIALLVMAGNHRCLFLLTLGHLARCPFLLPFFSLAMQMPANRQDMIPLLSPLSSPLHSCFPQQPLFSQIQLPVYVQLL